MARFVFSTCGVFAELLAFDTAGPPLILGLSTLGLIVGVLGWWTQFDQFIDRMIGLDLPHAAPQHHTEAD